MILTKEKILANKDKINGLDGYSLIIAEIEDNLTTNPDISIESCKALIEGLCKKALETVSDKYNSNKQLRQNCEGKMSVLIKTAFEEVYSNGLEKELHNSLYNIIKNKVRVQKLIDSSKDELLENGKKAINKITAIRHDRGDISHGRIYPKPIESEIHLAKSIKSITDGICSFMIHEFSLQYQEKLELSRRLIYENSTEYNEWLDEQNDRLTTKIDFSRLLFDNNYEKYEEIYYLDYLESTQIQKDEEEDVSESIEPSEKVEREIENLINTFNETTFWTEERQVLLKAFATQEKLKEDRVKKVVEDYLFTDKIPLPDEVINTFVDKPSLKERKIKMPVLRKTIVTFANTLNQGNN